MDWNSIVGTIIGAAVVLTGSWLNHLMARDQRKARIREHLYERRMEAFLELPGLFRNVLAAANGLRNLTKSECVQSARVPETESYC